MRFTTKEEIVLEENAAPNGTGARDGYKPIRYCKECKDRLTEENLLKRGDHICMTCKAGRSNGKHRRYQARIESDFHLKEAEL